MIKGTRVHHGPAVFLPEFVLEPMPEDYEGSGAVSWEDVLSVNGVDENYPLEATFVFETKEDGSIDFLNPEVEVTLTLKEFYDNYYSNDYNSEYPLVFTESWTSWK